MKKLINLFLLSAMFFSIAHGVVLKQEYAFEHCSIEEYISEFSAPDVHEYHEEHENNACDSHYIFHISFLVPETFALSEFQVKLSLLPTYNAQHLFTYQKNTFRPPII